MLSTAYEVPLQDFRFYDEYGRPTTIDYDPEFKDAVDEFADYIAEHQAVLEQNVQPKPAWFEASEREARRFLGRLAFDDLSPIFVVKNDAIQAKDLGTGDESIKAVAECSPWAKFIQFDLEQVQEAYDYKPQLVGRMIVHELAHDTSPRPSVAHIRKYPDGAVGYAVRQGFQTIAKRAEFGNFFEEHFAHFIDGWFYRRNVDAMAPMLSIEKAPTRSAPDHCEETYGMSYGGYTLEVLAWGIERHGIMKAENYLANLIRSRNPSHQLAALRQNAWAVERLRPELYLDLLYLEYKVEDWQSGFDMIYEAATAKIR